MVAVKPNSRNVVPGEVRFSVDLRHANDTSLDEMEAMLRDACDRVGNESGLDFEIQRASSYPTVQFHSDCVSAVRETTKRLGYKYMDIVSGAGHDACYVNRVAPTGMIFVPCEGGISHNEIENAKPEDLEAGANVLLQTMRSRAADVTATRITG
jgi:N-carbamoyl-L-amino-acid hydrolase